MSLLFVAVLQLALVILQLRDRSRELRFASGGIRASTASRDFNALLVLLQIVVGATELIQLGIEAANVLLGTAVGVASLFKLTMQGSDLKSAKTQE